MTTSLVIFILILSILTACLTTPLVIKFGYYIKAIDQPGERRVHTKAVPRVGGISIILSFALTFLVLSNYVDVNYGILLGTVVIGLTGFLDDLYQLSPVQKIVGQLLAAAIVIYSGVSVQFLSVPFTDYSVLVPGWIGIPITLIWIIGITNAVNLIDGLDGLAAGVSAIAALSIFVLAVIMGNFMVVLLSAALIGVSLGFLLYNFHPAKVFMGDTGALFLGFMLSVISLMGFKQVTTVSLIIPFIILGVPITDTFIAIIRRILQKKPITNADKSHLHHKLLEFGYSHKQTVLIIYTIAMVFGITAVFFSQANLIGSTIIFIGLVIFVELLVEKFSLISKTYRPILNLLVKLGERKNLLDK